MRLLIPLTVLLCVACLGEDAADPSGGGGPPPALVRVAEVGPGTLTEEWTALAEVIPLSRAELAAGVAGPVEQVALREGDRAEAGQVLLLVDDALAVAARKAADAAVAEAEVEHTRRQDALSRRQGIDAGVLSAEELADAAAAVEAQAARVQALEAAATEANAVLRRHRLRAPFDGVVTRRHVDPGDWVGVGQPVLDLVSTDDLEARVRVPQALADQLEVGVEVGLGDAMGVVVAVVPALDAITRTALVRIATRPGHGLSPGAAVPVSLPVSWEGVGVTVPRDALLTGPSETRLLLALGGVAQPVVVEVIATTADTALVTAEGLKEGAQVITRGNERVRPGQALRFEESE